MCRVPGNGPRVINRPGAVVVARHCGALGAALGQIEFAVLGMYFVVSATCIALMATGLLVLFWRLLISIAPALKSNRSWLVVYIVILGWPLYFGPISLYEWALAAPIILGFILPRFLVSKLKAPEIYVAKFGQAA